MEVSAELSSSQGGDVSNGALFNGPVDFGDDSFESHRQQQRAQLHHVVILPATGGGASRSPECVTSVDPMALEVDTADQGSSPPPSTLNLLQQQQEQASNTINPRQQQELCLVCGDRASGYHYNALTCEGCKGFFRRSITKNAVYQCKYGNSCDIDMYMRRKCQECRLKKCLVVGMRPECVVPEYQCAIKRESKKQVPHLPPHLSQQHVSPSTPQPVASAASIATTAQVSPQAAGLASQVVAQHPVATAQHSTAIVVVPSAPALVATHQQHSPQPQSHRSHHQLLRTLHNGVDIAPSNCISANGGAITDDLTDEKPNIMALNMAVRQVKPLTQDQEQLINKLVLYQQVFESPSPEDIKNITPFPLGDSEEDNERRFQHITDITILTVQLMVEFSKRVPGFDTLLREDQITLLKACSSEIMMLRGSRKYDVKTDSIVFANNQPYTRDNYKSASVGDSADALFRFCRNMCNLRVDNAEYALLTAIVIFSERPSLLEPDKVEKIQEFYIDTLRTYSENHRPRRSYFARLLSILTELRTLGNMNSEMCSQLKVQNKKLPPILAEIWDIQD